MAVPPLGMAFEAMLNVPGHNIPTDKPVMATPIKPTEGFGDKIASKYPIIHKTPLPAINLGKLIFSLNFA